MLKTQKGFSAIIIVLIIAAIALVGVIIWRISVSKVAVPDDQSASAPVTTQPTQSSFKIEQLGIEMDLAKELQDEIVLQSYTLSTTKATVAMSTKLISSQAPACAASTNFGDAALGALHKVDGQYPAEPTPMNTPGTLIKQFSNYYIAYSKPQQSCTEDKELQKTIDDTSLVLQRDMSTIREITE